MSEALVLLAVLVPLLVALASGSSRGRGMMGAMAPWTAGFALATALFVPPGTAIDLPWIMLGARMGLDATAQLFLGFTSLLWLLAGIYARTYLSQDEARHRFFSFYLVAMAGNFGLTLAQDVLTFLLGFAMMSFAAFGLVTHNRDAQSRRAGSIYMILVVAAEVLLFAGLVLAALHAGSLLFEEVRASVAVAPARDAIVTLLLLGFGLKLGVVPLHFWLPLAHPVAPTPASAVLSGAMIKAGLLGWIRFLPLGSAMMPNWGALCLIVGFVAAFYGVVVGLTQSHAKTVLAYSSVSQMGLVVVAVGSVLMAPGAWPTISSALMVFAFHHAISKGALFLGIGVADGKFDTAWTRGWVCAGLLLPALALAGLPLTLGGVAKAALKQATTTGLNPWSGWSRYLLPWSAMATTLLMARFLFLVWPRQRAGRLSVGVGMWLPWSTLVLSVVGMIGVLRWHGVLAPYWLRASPAAMWETTWPMVAGAGLAIVVLSWKAVAVRLSHVHIPAGDLVVPLGALTLRLRNLWQDYLVTPLTRWSAFLKSRLFRLAATSKGRLRLQSLTAYLENWGAVGLFAMLLIFAFIVLLAV